MSLFRRKNVGKLLITVGCGMIGCALVLWGVGQSRQKKLLLQYQTYVATHAAVPMAASNAGTVSADPSPLSDTAEEKPTVSNAIGVLSIPAIGLETLLVEGMDSDSLKYAVGHFIGTALPGEIGNFAVAGHSSGVYRSPFAQLDRLKVGDAIAVEYGGNTFSYRVTALRTVEPSEVSVLNPTDTGTMTLVTCTPPLLPTHRLIVSGALDAG